MRIFDRWRVVRVSYFNKEEQATGKEMCRYMHEVPFMTYRGASKWVKELEWYDTVTTFRCPSEYQIVRSTDTWK